MKKGFLSKGLKMMSLAFLLTVCSSKVSAQEGLITVDNQDAYVIQDGYIGEVKTSIRRSSNEVKQVIMEGLESYSSNIDISQYNISTSEISTIYFGLLNDNPSLFYVQGGYSYSYSGTKVISVKPKYHYTLAEIPAKKAAFEAEIAKALQVVNSSMTPQEKLLAVHDYIVADIEYGFTPNLPISGSSESYSAYGVFVNKKAVCNGYTLAMTELCNRIGIESKYVSSSAMNHAWNLVKIDGEWYHVDATWDDPTSNREGRVYHTNFLLSDAGITARNHHSWNSTLPAATSTRFENEFWKDVTTKIIYNNNNWYYVSKPVSTTHTINAYSYTNKTTNTIKSFYSKWPVWGGTGSYWLVGPSLATYNNKLYYNTNDKIVSMNFDGSGVVERAIDVTNGYIYGIGVHGNTMRYGISQSPNVADVNYEYSLLNRDARAKTIQKSLLEYSGLPVFEVEYEIVTE